MNLLAGRILERGRIDLVEAPEPTAAAGEIVFQPRIACLCGSDLPYFDGDDDEYPRRDGLSLHEMVGRVVDSKGERFRAGDEVLAVPVDQVGLFERFAVSEARAIPLYPGLAPEHALLAQPLGTVIFALKKIPHLLDRDVAVVGQGPIGQIFCAVLRNLGARQIIGIDKLDARLAMSPRMGATAVVAAGREDPLAAVTELTEGKGADLVVEAVGHDDQALNLCIDLCRPCGSILYFGVPPQEIDGVRWHDLMWKNIAVHTSVNPDFRRDFPLAMRWLGEGRLDLSGLVTHRFPLESIQRAFETFRDRVDGAQKVLLEFPANR